MTLPDGETGGASSSKDIDDALEDMYEDRYWEPVCRALHDNDTLHIIIMKHYIRTPCV